MMTPPTGPGLIAPGIRVTVKKLDAVQYDVDDVEPEKIQARVYVVGLVAGKASATIRDGADGEANAVRAAVGYAWLQAAQRIRKWERGAAQWDLMQKVLP